MRFSDDFLYPEKMQPLIITAAPYGPAWLPGDADVSVTWMSRFRRQLLVLVRTMLSWSLSVEMEGRWPWQAKAETPSQSPHPKENE